MQDVAEWIAEIERRAGECGLELDEMLRRAKVDATTWSRWKRGLTAPSWRKRRSVENVIARRENRMNRAA